MLVLSPRGAKHGPMFCTNDFFRTPFQCAGTRKLLNYFNDLNVFPGIVWITYHFSLRDPRTLISIKVTCHAAARTGFILRPFCWCFLPATLATHRFVISCILSQMLQFCWYPAASFSPAFPITIPFFLIYTTVLHRINSMFFNHNKENKRIKKTDLPRWISNCTKLDSDTHL